MVATRNEHFSPGSLVACRGRNWVVMPSNQDGLTLLRPVDGAEEDGIGVFSRIEPDIIRPSSYPKPNPDKAGDSGGAALLREAFRMNLRSGAGPFRSVGRAAATPRPYQYVPLAMALRMSPARLLIADDVGVGKTVETGFVARELLDRGAAKPHWSAMPAAPVRAVGDRAAGQVRHCRRSRAVVQDGALGTRAAAPRYAGVQALPAHRRLNRFRQVRPLREVFRGQRARPNHRGRGARGVTAARRRLRQPTATPSACARIGERSQSPHHPGYRHAAQRRRRELSVADRACSTAIWICPLTATSPIAA